MTGPQIIVLATPVFLLLIGFEFLIGLKRGRNTYRLNDALNSIGLGVMSQIVGVFSALFTVAIYAFAFEHVSLWQLSVREPGVWIAGLVLYDFCYYWVHRFGHTVALMWAAHVVHRLFGSFVEEDDAVPCVYGTRGPLRSWNPLWANLHNYADMAKDSWRARAWGDKLRVWFKHPGWRPADVAQRWPKPAFDLARVERFDPPMSRAAQGLAIVLFIVVLNAATLFLWFSHRMTLAEQAAAAALILAVLWAVGRVCEPSTGASVFSRKTPLRGLRPGPE